MLTLYNTMSRQKEPFKPLHPGEIRMYVCGPTVYNYIHIGNARSAIAFDTIRRYFEYRGFKVTYVSNFTDVDDKIITAAHKTGEAPLIWHNDLLMRSWRIPLRLASNRRRRIRVPVR